MVFEGNARHTNTGAAKGQPMPVQNEGTERFAQAQKPDGEGKGTRWFRGQGSLRGSG